jgi:hypothetical protein
MALGGALTTLYSFTQEDDGAEPLGNLVQDTNGVFYGVTGFGGDLTCGALGMGCGTVFSLNLGLSPFVTFVFSAGAPGQTGGILGQGLSSATQVAINGLPANFTVVSDTFLNVVIPHGATTGYVTVTTSSGILTSNVPFRVLP